MARLWSLLTIFVAIGTGVKAQESVIDCYGFGGLRYTENTKCPGTNSCCGVKDTCLSNGLCHKSTDGDDKLIRGPCSIRGYDDSCTQLCLYNETTGLLPRVEVCSDGTLCCDDDPQCCANGDGVFLDSRGKVVDKKPSTTFSFGPERTAATFSTEQVMSTSAASSTASANTATTTTNSKPATTTSSSADGDNSSKDDDNDGGGGSDNLGVKVGVGVAVPVAVIGIGVAAFFFWNRRRKRSKAKEAVEIADTSPSNSGNNIGAPRKPLPNLPPNSASPASHQMSQSPGSGFNAVSPENHYDYQASPQSQQLPIQHPTTPLAELDTYGERPRELEA